MFEFYLITSPVIVSTLVLGDVFAMSVTFFEICPLMPVLLKVTLITPSSPGGTGSFGYSGCVHPHEPFA
mgnify:CR=1 FL=1